MPVQRKVFRIEQSARAPAPTVLADDVLRQEFLTELHALRALIEPRAGVDRDAMERARAQIAEAQALKHELDRIHAAIGRTRDELGALGADAAQGQHSGRAGRELQAIVTGTEQATQSILQAAEQIDQTAITLSDALKSGHERGLAHDIQDRVVQIFEACNFQDLTGQRAAKVLATLTLVESHVARLMEIWRGVEQFKPIVLGEAQGGDRRYLNGPRLSDDPGHSSQNDIDAMFGCA